MEEKGMPAWAICIFYAVGHADNGCSVPEYPAISIDSRWFFKARK
jgi:hypothetical protein